MRQACHVINVIYVKTDFNWQENSLRDKDSQSDKNSQRQEIKIWLKIISLWVSRIIQNDTYIRVNLIKQLTSQTVSSSGLMFSFASDALVRCRHLADIYKKGTLQISCFVSSRFIKRDDYIKY